MGGGSNIEYPYQEKGRFRQPGLGNNCKGKYFALPDRISYRFIESTICTILSVIILYYLSFWGQSPKNPTPSF
jgi:hypothetical protein